MKHPLLAVLLILSSAHAISQSQAESKRPSWSQGLPERPASVQPAKPGITSKSPEASQPGTKDRSQLNAERPDTPQMEMELSTQPALDFDIITRPVKPTEQAVVTRKGQAHFQNRDFLDKQSNPLHDQYQWTPVKTTPIDMPPRYVTRDILKVRIYINPDGEVIKVTAGAPDVPALMFKQAQQSIRDWEFEPPKKIGITDNLAKTFEIEIKTG